VAVGFTAIFQGGFYLIGRDNSALGICLVTLLAIAGGALLLAGFLTPVGAIMLGIGAFGMALSWFPTSVPNLFEAKLSALFVAAMSAAIGFLGPGAYSVDSRLFGRREIIIPHAHKPSS
jgi:uncharacterized membrane protein YphA (DoxX/SURF4 family)